MNDATVGACIQTRIMYFRFCGYDSLFVYLLLSGLGAMGVSVEGAHRSDLEMKSTSATEYTFHYKPHEPGIYLLNIKFGDDHVNGTPRPLICMHAYVDHCVDHFYKRKLCVSVADPRGMRVCIPH